MEIKYFKEYSNCLSRDMEFKVYGFAGKPVLAFPAQDGRFYDFEGFGMVECISDKINAGLIQLFCVDSIDRESWSEINGNKQHRTYMHEQWFYYIINEIVPRIYDINGSTQAIITTGCSLGASHGVNFMLRRPDLFDGCIGLSGYYDSDLFFGDYHDDIIYKNSPIQYLQGMANEHPYIKLYQKCKIIICQGQGAFEDEMLKSAHQLQIIFQNKNIPAWVDYWGKDVSHEWTWWRIQLPYFIEKILSEVDL